MEQEPREPVVTESNATHVSQSLWENRFEPERREYRYGASRNIVARVRAISFSPNGLNIVFPDLAFGCLFPDDWGNAVGAQWDNDIGLSANDIAALPQRYFARCAKRYSPSATANGI